MSRNRPTTAAPLIAAMLMAHLLLPALCRAELPQLKDVYRNDFLIGVALSSPPVQSLTPAERQLLETQFNAVTPEDCMKAASVHPQENVWRFEDADTLVDFAHQHGMTVFGHTLVWHNELPQWMIVDGDHAPSRELALARLKTHIQTLVTRFKGRIRGWDVVNEALSDNPIQYLRPTPWEKIIGDDYVEQAFRFAHQADPNAELQYNDYNIELPSKREKAIWLIKDLQKQGIPIASVGIQGHWMLDHVPFDDIDAAIDQFQALGIKVAITELDLDVLPRRTGGADIGATTRVVSTAIRVTPLSPEAAQRQADQYARLFAIFHKHRAAIIRVTFWGLDDRVSWLNRWPTPRYNHPLLFDRHALPKPAFEAVIDLMKTPLMKTAAPQP
jgi:endo-1,4-beta-xylanase